MNLSDMSTQLLYTTVPVWTELGGGGQGVGTGFFYSVPVADQENRQIPLLITNYHVVREAKRGLIELVQREGEGPKRGSRIRIEVEAEDLLRHTHPDHDLAAIPVGGLLNQLEQAGTPVFFRSVSPDLVPTPQAVEDLAALEEITFIGYPSGLYDQHNVTPLIRRGITATPPWNEFQGQPAFLIDAGVFPGSSGSPVFILNQGAFATRSGLTVGNRLLFLGVLTETFLRHEAEVPQTYLGLGKVIKAAVVKAFVDDLAGRLLRQEADRAGTSANKR